MLQSRAPLAVTVSSIGDDHRRKMTTNGKKSILVVRVGSDDNASQSEATIYDDICVDDINLVSMH